MKKDSIKNNRLSLIKVLMVICITIVVIGILTNNKSLYIPFGIITAGVTLIFGVYLYSDEIKSKTTKVMINHEAYFYIKRGYQFLVDDYNELITLKDVIKSTEQQKIEMQELQLTVENAIKTIMEQSKEFIDNKYYKNRNEKQEIKNLIEELTVIKENIKF